jgi:hypothetical protein
MENNQKKLSVLANKFKVEELMQRIEFDMAMEGMDGGDGWKEARPTTVTTTVEPDGKITVKAGWGAPQTT